MKEIVELSKNLSLVYRFVYEEMAKETKKIGLTNGLSILLIGIMRNEEVNQFTLGKKIHVDTATISRNIKILEDNGYVKKKVDENNRRSCIVSSTKKGIDKANESLEIQYGLWNKMFGNFTREELRDFNDFVTRLTENTFRIQDGEDLAPIE